VTPSILHVVFGESAAVDLKRALILSGRADAVLVLADDYSFGPIDPPDPQRRSAWVESELGYEGFSEWLAQGDAFWVAALATTIPTVAWTSRRSTRDSVGFLEFLWRREDRPCDVIDLTDLMITTDRRDGSPPSTRLALSPSMLHAEQIVAEKLFDRARPLESEERNAHWEVWRRLRDENAPLRVLTPQLDLVSAPIDYFDRALLSHATNNWRKVARIVGGALAESWEDSIIQVGDFVLAARVRALVAAGYLESQGDLSEMRFSEVRLPAASGRETA
jgi:hypothetical protein